MIACADAVRQLWEYLDGTIDRAAGDDIAQHLARCRRCCGELEFATELRGMLARSAHDDIPPEVLDRLNQTLEDLGP